MTDSQPSTDEQTTPERDRVLAEWHQKRFREANGVKGDGDETGSGRSDSVRPVVGAERLDSLALARYVLSEPHLGGYRLVIGFETLADVQAAHEAIAAIRGRS